MGCPCKKTTKTTTAIALPRQGVTPCAPCAVEYIRLARTVHDRGEAISRVVWHLLQASRMTPDPVLRERLVNTRRAFQRQGVAPAWTRLVDAATDNRGENNPTRMN